MPCGRDESGSAVVRTTATSLGRSPQDHPPTATLVPSGSVLVVEEVELDSVQQRVVGDGTRVGRALAQGFPVSLPGPADVVRRDGGEGHEVDGVHLDLRRADAVTASLFDFGLPPETE